MGTSNEWTACPGICIFRKPYIMESWGGKYITVVSVLDLRYFYKINGRSVVLLLRMTALLPLKVFQVPYLVLNNSWTVPFLM